jgi:hypothetical protein
LLAAALGDRLCVMLGLVPRRDFGWCVEKIPAIPSLFADGFCGAMGVSRPPVAPYFTTDLGC